MNPVFKHFRPGLWLPAIAMLSLTLGLAGCGKEEPQTEVTEDQDRPRMVERQAPRREARAEPAAQTQPDEDFRVIPKLEAGSEEEGMGLDLIIDASSKQAYAESLRWMAQDASREQIASLERSVRYIHMYDPSVLGREERMLEIINGKTGNEVIAHAATIAQRRRGGN